MATDPKTAPQQPFNFGKLWLITGLIIAVAFFAGMLPRWKARAALQSESVDQAAPYVSIINPKPGTNTAALVLPGEVRPLVESPIYARASGYLKSFQVDIGQLVKQGDLLAEIDTPELDRQLEQTRAELALAQANLTLAKTTAARWQELLKTASVSEQETAEKTAALASQTANVDAASAQLHRLEELAGFKRITAPFDGTVTTRTVDLGMLINAGAGRELFHLAQMHKLRVFVKVPQASSALMAQGVEADVTFTDKPGHKFPAKIVRTAGAIDTDTRTLLTELEVDNASGEILAGAYAEVHFRLPSVKNALVVPSNTLLFRAEGPQLGIVNSNDVVELRQVLLGRDYGTTLEIISGIIASDRVILNPSDSLVSGSAVRVAQATTKTSAK